MNEIIETWKPIIGYETRYLISNLGHVKSINSNIILKPEIRRGYYSVQLFNGKTYKHFSIHRLVALAFIDNSNKYTYVNHKDENKLNNCINNLEWCTASYNINYGTAIKRAIEKKRISIIQLDKNYNYINTFLSCMDAERNTGIYNGNIIACCKGRRKTAGGYIWKYEVEKENKE